MTLQEYSEKASRTLVLRDDELLNDIHMILGMQTEVAEIADVYKKEIAYGKTPDLVNVKEEIGDLMWYVVNFCRINKFDLYTILETNINKLSVRYPEEFSTKNALNRDLNVERKILEQ
jgi:NTP pyrophosphatase (non-canonical NTP hydrolase)